MAETVKLAAIAGAWIVAALSLPLLFDLKATATTLAALVVLTALALPAGLRPAAVAALVAPALVFAAFVVHPLAAFAVLALALAGIAALLRPLAVAWRGRLAVAAGVAATIWPAVLGLVSNSVVELACPEGGIETACYGFYRVGTD